MWKSRTFGLIAAAILLTGGTALAASSKNFGTHLHGAEEVPPRDTQAQGQATFQLSEDGTELSYKLNVANIENVIMAHIHLEEAGQNGDIVVWLYPSTTPGQPEQPGGGRIDGRIVSGVITADDLIGPLDGEPLSELIEAIESGGAYVNVHTSDGAGANNTGPGDFQSGEIRGQLP